jgi:Domain of unknown function (DUF4333)
VSGLRSLSALLVLGLPACASGPLPAEDVATKAEDALEAKSGVRPDIVCPEDLAARVGARTRCTLTAGNDPTEYGVLVIVTSIDGTRVRFDIEVDDQPKS